IQDMGAAGLTSSSAEMAARGGVGVEIDTGLVPTREPDMTPYEIMLSESQERMLVVAEPPRLDHVIAVCRRWDLDAVAVGRVTDDGVFRVVHHGLVVASIPGRELIENCPVYSPPAEESPAARTCRSLQPAATAPPVEAALAALLDAPTIASKRWVFEQFDSTVRAGSVLPPGGDAGVLQVAGTPIGIAMTIDCNARHVWLDPYEGGKSAVAEAARNVACTGARPLGVTDCLNFGNPERPDVFFQLKEACRGIAEACRAFGTPVTGGNVSLYNESPRGAIEPTPTIGMIGLLTDVTKAVPSHFRASGDCILLLGTCRGELGGSAYWAEVLGTAGGAPPHIDLAAEHALQQLLCDAADARLLRSAHDLSDGGLGIALAEACIGGPWATQMFGADIDSGHHGDELEPDAWFFGEEGARAVVSCHPMHVADIHTLAERHGVPCQLLGKVGAADGTLAVCRAHHQWRWPVSELRAISMNAIPRRMAPRSSQGGC
ncbi:MAG: AIR synthase-related protein, partial [Gemmatimonadales bacterium]